MPPRLRKLFQVATGTEEVIHPLLQEKTFRLEHIVSHGQASAPDFWYDQPKAEWVMLIRGTASLQFQHHPALALEAGDSLLIPAHCRHRVSSTSSNAQWVALHFESELSESVKTAKDRQSPDESSDYGSDSDSAS